MEIIEYLVNEVKKELFYSSEDHFGAQVSASAYDTAWVAMVPDPGCPDRPMFPGCLTWVLQNQKEGGFWGETEPGNPGLPSIDCLPATMACLVALRVWNIGPHHVARGLKFVQANAEKLLAEHEDGIPGWFSIVFPGIMELAISHGIEVFPTGIPGVVKSVFAKRQKTLAIYVMKDLEQTLHPPLLSYLEVLPKDHGQQMGAEHILQNLSEDGSLFQSPSATASAYMTTGDKRCMAYLEAVVGSDVHKNGVPSTYPVDEVLVKMVLVDWLESAGCAEHFADEIDDAIKFIYSDWTKHGTYYKKSNAAFEIYRDSLAFRLLRMHGYQVTPKRFCWFLHDEEMLHLIEEKHECFLSVMLNIYKASNFVLPGESELDKARVFSTQMLNRAICNKNMNENHAVHANIYKQIDHELRRSWITRMEHLEERNTIESGIFYNLRMSKISYKLVAFNNQNLIQLAKENFTFRQSIFRDELEELKRWSKDWNLSTIGFGREKTQYCYFLAASQTTSLVLSEARKMVAKCSILVTVADDFFDSKGSLEELYCLTDAIRRWDGQSLDGNSRIIFNALHGLVKEIEEKCHEKIQHDLTETIKDLWSQAFTSWLKEAEWSRNGYVPSLKEYLEVGIISIAIQAMVLPACCMLFPEAQNYVGRHEYDKLTMMVMVSARLLNDTQSYQKEMKEGKLNTVTLCMMENPMSDVDDIVSSIKKILEMNKREALKLILLKVQDENCMPRVWKDLHLSALKAFHFLFDSTNMYDSSTALVQSINDAFYNPIALNDSYSTHLNPLREQHVAIPDQSGTRKGKVIALGGSTNKTGAYGCQESSTATLKLGTRVQQLRLQRRISATSFSMVACNTLMPKYIVGHLLL